MSTKIFWVGQPNTISLGAEAPGINKILSEWLNSVFLRIGSNPFQIPTFTVGSLPSANRWADGEFTSIVGVSDETGGYTLAFSDGIDWRRVQDTNIVA